MTMTRCDLTYMAATLLNKGWSPDDSEDIMRTCHVSPDDIQDITARMREMVDHDAAQDAAEVRELARFFLRCGYDVSDSNDVLYMTCEINDRTSTAWHYAADHPGIKSAAVLAEMRHIKRASQ